MPFLTLGYGLEKLRCKGFAVDDLEKDVRGVKEWKRRSAR